MILESILAFLHLSAIFAVIVFATSEAALCRSEWMNARIVERLVRVDRIYWIALITLVLTGLARVFWGIKGDAWYWSNWLLHVKLTMTAIVLALSLRPTLRFRRWVAALRSDGSLPAEAEVTQVRKMVMVSTHIVPLIPLAAVFLARGFGGR
jgi:putative membrane protein